MRRRRLNRFTAPVVTHLALSLLWLASCLPVVTAPAGTAALFEVARLRARGDDPELGRSFVLGFRQYFPTAALVGLGWAALGAILVADLLIVTRMAGPAGSALQVALLSLLVLYALVTVSLFPVLVSHQAGPYQLVRTAALVTLLAPGRALLGLATVGVAVAAVWAAPLSLIIAPSLTAAVLQRLYRNAFERLRAKAGTTPVPDRAAAVSPTAAAARS